MTDHGNLFDGCLHVFRNLDDSGQRWIALHDTREDIAEDSFNLPVDQVVNPKLVKTVCLFQLPGAGPAHNNLWTIFPDCRMGDNLEELMRIEGSQIFPEDLGVNICRIGDAEWIVGVYGQHFRLRANKFLKVSDVASNDLFFRIFPE